MNNEKLLWSNPDPSSPMDNGADITLSSDDYDIYEIFFYPYGSEHQQYVISNRGIKGKTINLVAAGFPSQGVSAWYREITVIDNTHLRVGNCRGVAYDKSWLDNTKMTPLYIIGYKSLVINQ